MSSPAEPFDPKAVEAADFEALDAVDREMIDLFYAGKLDPTIHAELRKKALAAVRGYEPLLLSFDMFEPS